MVGLPRRSLPLFAVFLLGTLAAEARACPFCSQQGPTLTGEVAQASMVLYGSLADANETAETTRLVIDDVIKDHPILAGRKTLTLQRYIPPTGDKYKFLVFCDVFKEKVDPYRGMAFKKDCAVAEYLRGAVKHKDEKPNKRLRFFFDYLDNPETEISNDAYKEFANADYKDYRDMARDLPAARVAGWLRDPNTPSYRFGLYASMLGHCGKDKDAALLRSMLEDKDRRISSGIDGLLAGYVMLKPREGWAYTRGILADGHKEFMLRYAALRALRFLWDSRPDLVARKELAEGLSEVLDQPDIADLAIEDLRKWQYWSLTPKVLGLRDKPAYDLPIVRRAILRYCLSCPDKTAAVYVADQRKKDAQGVSDAEELLKWEQETPGKPPAGSKPEAPSKPAGSSK